MNCQDVIGILDELQFDRIEPRQRQKVEAHVATCAECARAWHAQSSLAELPDLPMPGGLSAQCRVAVARRFAGASAAGRSNRRRVVLWGSLTAMAAAAAALVLLYRPAAWSEPAGTAQALQGETMSPIVDAEPVALPAVDVSAAQPNLASAAARESVAAPRFTVRVAVSAPPPLEDKELHALATDPAAREVLQYLRAALAAQLRKVPGIAVVNEDPAQISASSRHYRVRLGPAYMVGVDHRPMRREHLHDINLTVQEVRSGGSTIDRNLYRGFAVDTLASCTSPEDAERMPCDTPMTAAFMVQQLRQSIFPADASVTQPLQAKFQDFSVAPEERFKAFVELFRQQAKTGGNGLLGDAAMVRAAVEMSQLTDAAHRKQLWRAMRGVGNPLLIEPLMASLQQDTDDARIAAVETLAADFSGHPRARTALEVAAVSDPHPLVRAMARRGLHGEEEWEQYVVTSLKDPAPPASQRVEALLHKLYPPDTIDEVSDPSPENYWQILKDLDDSAVRALAEVFPKAEQLRKWPGNNLVGNFAAVHQQHPAVTEMLLTVLEHDTRALNRSVAGESLAQTQADKPRVRAALIRAVNNDPASSVRDYLRQVLDRDYVKKLMGAAAN